MSHYNKVWKVVQPKEQDVQAIVETLRVPFPVAQALVNRGISEVEAARNYLNPKLGGLSDPFLLPDMDKATTRIEESLRGGEQIVIHGDYDVDGITSTSLLMEVLRQLGGDVEAFIPHRLDDGYGLSVETLERCEALYEPRLLITVDCGTGSVAAVERANMLGIDVIVTDHHEASEGVASALAVVNPKLGEDVAGSHHLAGVGVVFKLCHALLKKMNKRNEVDLREYLYLVGMGTVADVVSLRGENRVLAHAGINGLNRCTRPGIQQLAKVSGVSGEMGSYHIGFLLGPRINAAGRLSDPATALKLLQETSHEQAAEIAKALDATNRERQQVEKEILAEAIEHIETDGDFSATYPLVVAGEGWHPGVVGILASRLVSKYHRPAVVVGFDDSGLGKGSARSIDGFDLVEHLRKAGKCLEQFGGHKMAAGLALRKEHFERFKSDFRKCSYATLKKQELRPILKIDAWITLADINYSLIDWIKKMEPFGMGNRRPLFGVKKIWAEQGPHEVGKGHLKVRLTDGMHSFDAIAFNWGNINDWPSKEVDVVFQAQLNSFRNKETLQLNLQDVSLSAF